MCGVRVVGDEMLVVFASGVRHDKQTAADVLQEIIGVPTWTLATK